MGNFIIYVALVQSSFAKITDQKVILMCFSKISSVIILKNFFRWLLLVFLWELVYRRDNYRPKFSLHDDKNSLI